MTGAALSSSSFYLVDSEVSTITAKETARNRTLLIIAQDLGTRIGSYLLNKGIQ